MTTASARLPLPVWRRLEHTRDVLAVLVARDLKVLYKRSFLGFGWALATPLLQLLVFTLLFKRVLAIDIPHYPAFVFTGVLVWGWFQASLIQTTGLITNSRAFVRQPGFPLALLPHVTIGVRLFHFILAMPLLVGLLYWHGLHPTVAWFALPVLVLVQFVLTAGLAYPLAALNVRLRDTQHMVAAGAQLLMYLTPVFYSLDLVPAAGRAWMNLNPMVPLLTNWRAVLLEGAWPDFVQLGWLSLVAVILLVAGRRVFLNQAHRFVEEL